MLFAADTATTQAAITGVVTLIVGVVGAWVALRGNTRSTTTQLDANRNMAWDSLQSNLLAALAGERAENAELREDRDNGWNEARHYRGLFEDAREKLERCEKERHGPEHPDLWRYKPPGPAT